MTLWTLIQRLKHMRRGAEPDKAYVAALKERLRSAGYFSQKTSHFYVFSWQRVTASFVLVSGLLVGTASYAFYAPEVVPTHLLYGVKTRLEKWEVTLAPSSDKERVRLTQLQKHVEQVKTLLNNNKSEVSAQTSVVLNDLNKEIDHASSTPAATEQEEILRDHVVVDRDELSDLADQQKDVPSDAVDEKKLVHQMLVDQTDRLEQHVTTLLEHKSQSLKAGLRFPLKTSGNGSEDLDDAEESFSEDQDVSSSVEF